MPSESTKGFDLIIVGGGAGAFAAAIEANDHQAKTLMVNAGLPLGGTCVNVGCVPSKRLLLAAEMLHMARSRTIPGIKLDVGAFDFEKLIDDELDLVSRMQREKYHDVLKKLDAVTFVEGYARFVAENEIEVNQHVFRAPKIIIATGSRAKIPPLDGLVEIGFITHVEALKNRRLPKSLTIIGAGPVAVEFAQMFSRFGSKVAMVKRSAGILRFAEKELTKRLEEILADEGIDIFTVDAFQKATMQNGKKGLVVSIDGKAVSVLGDEILVGTGKAPNTEGLGLEEAGVDVGTNNAIVVNEFFQTSTPHIFAVGDVTNKPLRLETTAAREGTLAAKNALTGSKETLDYDSVPFTVFTDPQLAGVGLTEQDQMKRMGTCLCRSVPFEKIPKAILMNR
ncbi:MAG: FAD-dependent oxidoreductase, partial [Deltaproteobacteria bacterium]|nr:FAD-dependent oxidoreductase [Deltaproteobacteria bacterium]